MTENIIVALIVGAAAIFTIYRFFGKKSRGGCGCGCDGCGSGRTEGGKRAQGAENALTGGLPMDGGCPHCASGNESSVKTDDSGK